MPAAYSSGVLPCRRTISWNSSLDCERWVVSGRRSRVRGAGRIAQRGFGAGLDLGRVDDAAEPPARMPLRQVHDADGFLEVVLPSRLVPVESELVPVPSFQWASAKKGPT